MDARIARQKWDSILAKTEPIIATIEEGSFSRTDLYQLAEVIESQSKLASKVFKSQIEILERQAKGYTSKIEKKLKEKGIQPSNANVDVVIEKVFQKLVASELPKILNKVQKVTMTYNPKTKSQIAQEKKEEKERQEEKAKEKRRENSLLFYSLDKYFAAFGIEEKEVREEFYDRLVGLTDSMSSFIGRAIKPIAQIPFIAKTIDNSLELVKKVTDPVSDWTKKIIQPVADKALDWYTGQLVEKDGKQELQRPLLAQALDPFVNSIISRQQYKAEQKKVEQEIVGQAGVSAIEGLTQPIMPEINLDPIIESVDKYSTDTLAKIEDNSKKLDWLVNHFQTDNIVEKKVKPKTKKDGLLAKVKKLVGDAKSNIKDKVKDTLGSMGWIKKLLLAGGAFLSVSALTALAWQTISNIDWLRVLKSIGGSILDGIKWLFGIGDGEKEKQRYDSQGREVDVVEDPNGGFLNVFKDGKGNISTNRTDYDPRIIEDGKHKGFLIEKQEPMADAQGTTFTLYDPKTQKRKVVQKYDDGVEAEYEVKGGKLEMAKETQISKPKLQTSAPVQNMMASATFSGPKLTEQDSMGESAIQAISDISSFEAPAAKTVLDQKVQQNDLGKAVAKPKEQKPTSTKGKDTGSQSSAINLSNTQMMGTRNNDGFAILNLA